MGIANIDNKKMNFNTVLNFGKYKGHTIGEVFQLDASYLLWAIEETDRLKLSEKDIELIEEKAEMEEWDRFEDYDYNIDPFGSPWYDDD